MAVASDRGGAGSSSGSFLAGVRVLEVADELGEYCGKVLAGLGADVVKVEPVGGEVTRSYGPFLGDEPGPDRSLYFWHYNFGKRAMVLNLESPEGQERFRSLAKVADIVIDTRPRGWMEERGLGSEALRAINPALIYSRISPFGDEGPWKDYSGSDLVHLALGGVMMNCGYDPDPEGHYETPPIAPQMWQAYQIAGEMAAMSTLAALIYRLRSATGQLVSTNVHEAVAKNTETDLPDWIYLRQTHHRLTCRHSTPQARSHGIVRTKDGRWILPYTTYLKGFPDAIPGSVRLLKKYGMQADLEDPKYSDPEFRARIEVRDHFGEVLERLIRSLTSDRNLWMEAQEEGLPWAPVRRPEENVTDEHWQARETFFDVDHPELGRSFTYIGARWYAPGLPWRNGPRPPLLDEHTEVILEEWTERSEALRALPADPVDPADEVLSVHGKPFALAGVRMVDLSWQLASAGAGRFLAALGAEVIKVEHESRWDGMRFGLGIYPDGGRAVRDAAEGPLPTPTWESPNRSGSFMEINAGKLGISLNLKSEQGKHVLTDLIRSADVVAEGFSPGTMERMGFGYDRLREMNPGIIYVQQSGMGQHGTYGNTKSFGPTAQALTGLSDMSGLPDPWQPAGIGYSYLDWFGAYNMANATLAALYRRRSTGRGCWIDSSQAETGIYLTGTAVLDHSANGRTWSRYGNRSPYKAAAPHGAYRVAGDDRWIAIAAFTEEQWNALAEILGDVAWASDERFATLKSRLQNQDALDELISSATEAWDGVTLMQVLQQAGIPAGVCQDAQDRVENDPQLAHVKWLVELEQEEIGVWPIKDYPGDLSMSPAHIGGRYNRSGPSYGQDTDYVLTTILKYPEIQVENLKSAGAI